MSYNSIYYELGALPSSQKDILHYYIETLNKEDSEFTHPNEALITFILRPTVNTDITFTKKDDRITIEAQSHVDFISGINYLRFYHQELSNGTYYLTPYQKERGLLLDCGRKFYTIEQMQRLLMLMQQLNLNALQLHFNDNEGFRIQSETFPEIVSENHWTKEEVRLLLKDAHSRGIQIIPELDSPGHLRPLLDHYPEYRLTEGKYTSHLDYGALDITNSKAVEAIYQLYDEYMKLFQDCEYFHIGADEFIDFSKAEQYPKLLHYAQQHYGPNSKAIDVYIHYVNQLAEYVHNNGFNVRIWNDGVMRLDHPGAAKLNDNIEICYWTNWHKGMAPVQNFLSEKYTILNYNDNFFYFVLGENAGYTYPTAKKIENDWDITLFSGGQHIEDNQLKSVKGTYFSIWGDKPDALDAEQIMSMIQAPLAAKMKKEWFVSQ